MNVLLVDDDQLCCQSLQTILEADPEISVSGTGHSGREAAALYPKLRPDVLLMDIRMEDGTGLDAAAEILAAEPDARILFLTTFSDDEYIVRALRLGAKGYILKQDFESIVPALHAVYSGQSVFGSGVAGKLPALMQRGGAFDYEAYGIGEKELAIITRVAEGQSNREIAEALYLSEGTVRNYLSAILEKLELRDRTQLAVFYLRHQ